MTEYILTQKNAPAGTVATIGHPAHMNLIAKNTFGVWRYLSTGLVVPDEDFRAGWNIYRPMSQ